MEKVESIIQNNRQIVKSIKDHIEVVNCDFILNHIEIKCHYITTRRDCNYDDSWTCPYITYDSFAQQLFNLKNEHSFLKVHNTELTDSYFNFLIDKHYPVGPASNKDLCDLYNRHDHIIHLLPEICVKSVWNEELSSKDRKQVEDSLIEDLKILDFQIDSLSEFECKINGYSIICKINHYKDVILKKAKASLANPTVTHNNKISTEEKSLEIPFVVKKMHMEWNVTDISDYFFDECDKLESVVLPDDLKSFSWCFGSCPELKEIKIKNRNRDVYYKPEIISHDGILYRILPDRHTCHLLAFPNKYSRYFEIPKSIEVHYQKFTVSAISEFAFKCCDFLEVLHIPNTVKHIAVNAFYRCNNLKYICYHGRNINELKIDGFEGDYGSVNPKWLTEINVPATQPKVDYSYINAGNNNGYIRFIIGSIEFNMIFVPEDETGFFFIGETPVTNSLWSIIMNDRLISDYDCEMPVKVNYLQVHTFLYQLHLLTGIRFWLPNCYSWMIAAKGGKEKINFDNGFHNTIDFNVKSIKTNDYGLYDMIGYIGYGEICEPNFGSRINTSSILERYDDSFLESLFGDRKVCTVMKRDVNKIYEDHRTCNSDPRAFRLYLGKYEAMRLIPSLRYLHESMNSSSKTNQNL